MACSEDAAAEHTDATIAAMRAKHPAPHPDTNFPLPPQENEPQPPIAVTEQDVAQVVLSFPRGSAGGHDGLLPQHLKDLISNSARFGGKKLLAALMAFTNLVLSENTPVQVWPLFFRATLTALNKKDGRVRPIAVGCTLRRMVAKVASRTVWSVWDRYWHHSSLDSEHLWGQRCSPLCQGLPPPPHPGPCPPQARLQEHF